MCIYVHIIAWPLPRRRATAKQPLLRRRAATVARACLRVCGPCGLRFVRIRSSFEESSVLRRDSSVAASTLDLFLFLSNGGA